MDKEQYDVKSGTFQQEKKRLTVCDVITRVFFFTCMIPGAVVLLLLQSKFVENSFLGNEVVQAGLFAEMLIGFFGMKSSFQENNNQVKASFALAVVIVVAIALVSGVGKYLDATVLVGILLAVSLSIGLIVVMNHMDDSAKEQKVEEERIDREQEYWDSVKETFIVDASHTVTSKTSTGDTIWRTAVGNALFGPMGGLVGAMTAKEIITEHNKITFLIRFKDGDEQVVTVDEKSTQYDKLMSKLTVAD